MSDWRVGDQIGPISQTQYPRVLIGWGEVLEVHEDGLTVQWPGEKQPNRLIYVRNGMQVERREN